MENQPAANAVFLAGKIETELIFSHKSYGEDFYSFIMESDRISGYGDMIPVIVSERLIFDMNLKKNDFISVDGQLRTYNKIEEGKNRLHIVVFAKDIKRISELKNFKSDNKVRLEGFICKKPLYRLSPLGREICDLMLAVNRSYNKSDYIPCIAWGRNAKYTSSLGVGSKVKIEGRIQSREYRKKIDDENFEIRTALEVSILKIEE